MNSSRTPSNITDGNYNLLRNPAGEILIIIDVNEIAPVNPRLVYSGGDSAILYRSPDSAIRLSEITPEASKVLRNVDHIRIVEIQGEDISREYTAPVYHLFST